MPSGAAQAQAEIAAAEGALAKARAAKAAKATAAALRGREANIARATADRAAETVHAAVAREIAAAAAAAPAVVAERAMQLVAETEARAAADAAISGGLVSLAAACSRWYQLHLAWVSASALAWPPLAGDSAAAAGGATVAAAAEVEAAVAELYRPGWAGPLWMETGDAAGGFHELQWFPGLRLAVSAAGRLPGSAQRAGFSLPPPPPGWRTATVAELASILEGAHPAPAVPTGVGACAGFVAPLGCLDE